MRLRTALLGLLACIGVVLAGTVYAGFALHKAEIVDQEQRDLQVTAEAIAENLDIRVEEKRRMVELAGADPAAARHGSRAQWALVERFVDRTEFDGGSIVAGNGTMVAIEAHNLSRQRRGDLLGADFGHRPYVSRALAGRTTVGEPFRAESGNVLVTISTPVTGPDGGIVGAFTGTLHIRHSSVFARLGEMHGPNEAVEITSGNRTLYATSSNETASGVAGPAATDLERARSDGSGYTTATAVAESGNWTLRVVQGPGTVDDRLFTATALQVGAVGLALALMAVVGLGVYRTTVRHLDALIDGLTRLEAGEYDQELALGVTDEWTRIGHQFNALADTLEQRDSQLRVLNRVLRHNLRNDMSVIIARAEAILYGSGSTDDAEHVHQIRDTAYALVETGDHARAIYQELLAGADVSRTPVDVATVVAQRAEDLRAEFPRSAVETDLPADAWTMDGDALPIVVDELGRNALVHSDRPPAERRVHLSVARDADAGVVEIRVRDNGPGLPEVEAELLTGERQESSIEHGSGLGLWVVAWLVEQLGGDITVEAADSRGTAVSVRLPAVERPEADAETSTAGDAVASGDAPAPGDAVSSGDAPAPGDAVSSGDSSNSSDDDSGGRDCRR